jgi:hypothetical protein
MKMELGAWEYNWATLFLGDIQGAGLQVWSLESEIIK